MTRPHRIAALVVACAAAIASCSSVDTETQITVALSSETQIPSELDSFSIRVISTRTGELRFSQDYFPSSGRDFPTTLAVIPLDEESLDRPVRIELEGRKGGAVFLRRQAVVSYFEGRNLLLSMPLRMACFQFMECGPTATCAGGECVPVEVSPERLVDYDKSYVFGAPGACFDEEACLAESAEVDVADDCSFAIPAGLEETRGNVAIRWAAALTRILALDARDDQEGWSRVSADRGRLSQGACDSHFRRRGPDGQFLVPDFAEKIYFAATCPSKTGIVPYCFSERTAHAGIGALRP